VSPPLKLGLIRDVAISADGKLAMAGDSERTIWVWDVPNRKLVRVIPDPLKSRRANPRYAFSADGKFALVGNRDDGQRDGWPIVEPDPSTLTFWDLNAGVKLRTFELVKDEQVQAIALSPDGRWAVSSSVWKTIILREPRPDEEGDLRSLFSRCVMTLYALKVWDTSTGKLVHTLSDTDTTPFRCLAFTPDSEFLMTPLIGPRPPFGEKQTWYLKKWKTSWGQDFGAKSMEANWTYGIGDTFALSPDGKSIVMANVSSVGLWNLTTGKLLWEQSCYEECKIMHEGRVLYHGSIRSLAFSPDSKRVVAAGWGGQKSGGMIMMDAVTGKKMPGFVGLHDGSVWSTSFTPDGRTLIGATVKGMRCWEARTGAALFALKD
jgi:WD40 repeat protein